MSIDPKCIDHKKNLQSSTVLEHTGVPVTGTPSIYLEFNFIINRWAIYKTNIDGEPSINDILNRWRTCDRYTCISRTECSFYTLVMDVLSLWKQPQPLSVTVYHIDPTLRFESIRYP